MSGNERPLGGGNYALHPKMAVTAQIASYFFDSKAKKRSLLL